MDTKQTKKRGSKKKPNPIISTSREVLWGLGSPEKEIIHRIRGGVDKPFLIIVLLLICFGSVMVSSAGYAYAKANLGGDSFYFIKKQLVWALIGIVTMVGMSIVDYGFLKKHARLIFVISYLLLWCVFLPYIGVEKNGARRWVNFYVVQFQPSEIMKFALVLILSLYISKFSHKTHTFKYGIFIPACIVVFVCGTVALEKHMSATIILFLLGAGLIFVSGAGMKWIGAIAGVFGTAAASIILFTDYTKARVDAWLHPENDLQGSGWQPYQSLLAIGSGGLFGVGLGKSYQKQLYLPEPQNDFIFAIVCEELGLVGALALISLFLMLIWRGYLIAKRAPDVFSSMLALGLVMKVGIQALLNIAVVTTTIPTTGIALPFFSYGGTALVMQMAEMGIVLSISRFSSGEKQITKAEQFSERFSYSK